MTKTGYIAIYMRVSTAAQSTASQETDLHAWVKRSDKQEPVHWFVDSASGKTMHRPEWDKLYEAILRGEVGTLLCWRLDRLGRTAAGLTKLFALLNQYGVKLVSLKDKLDLSTPAGKLIAHVIASVAEYETELRGERVKAGLEAAKAKGKTLGGRAKGSRSLRVAEKIPQILSLADKDVPLTQIAQLTSISAPTIRSILSTDQT